MLNLFQNIFYYIYKKWIYRKIDTTDISDLKNERIIEPELLIISEFIHEGDIVFDIGAVSYTHLTLPTNREV